MGTLWYILILFPVWSNCAEIFPSEELEKNWTRSNENTISIDFYENNHVLNANRTELFTVKYTVSNLPFYFITDVSFKLFNDTRIDIDNKTILSTFYTDQFIDYETETKHKYELFGLYDSNGQYRITINTINYDDEQPTLTAAMCSMDENTNYTATNSTCYATLSDPDGFLNQTTFEILNSNPSATGKFDLEDQLFRIVFDQEDIPDNIYSTMVKLISLETLDYESKIFYSFIVQAKDGAGHSTSPNENVTFMVDVGDLNDMPPIWSDYFNTKEITEKTRYEFTVKAVDGDRKIDAAIRYYLENYDEGICEEACIQITKDEASKSAIITVNSIDRDAQDLSTYKFSIRAQEEDDPPYNATLNITFFLEDLDDNSPLFMHLTTSSGDVVDLNDAVVYKDGKIIEFSFLENFAGTIDGVLFIQDIDTGVNAQFSVELREDEEKLYKNTTYTDAFLVIPTAGYRKGDFQISVRNYTYLDFENVLWQNISFFIHSYGTNTSNADNLLVKINLIDYNDEWPIFPETSYETSVNETIKIGEELIIVLATDRDAEDAELEHTLVGADVIINLLKITNDGVITVSAENAFDYDRINPVIFQVRAIDKAQHSTTVPVTVNLLDINNKAPTYINGIIEVEENQKINTELNATIIASDVDTTRNLTARIEWDRSYAMKNSQPVNISIEENLQAMRFLDISFEKIPDKPDSINIKLIVNDNNKNQSSPDYETFDTLYLYVNITDLNTQLPEFVDKMSIDALIIVNIIDINDNAPEFTEVSINRNRTVYEESKLDTIVGIIEATDKDVGDTVTYNCTNAKDEPDWINCDSSGTITVKNDSISADIGYRYNFTINCTATDEVHVTPQLFTIYIMDKNNKIPDLLVDETWPSTEIVSILEKSAINTKVTTFDYHDLDRDYPFRTVRCTLNPSDECYENFIISNDAVYVSKGAEDLDRDTKKSNYTCVPRCYDNPQLEQYEGQNVIADSNSTFMIKLIDINDHCPEVQKSDFSIRENLKKGETVAQIVAKDIDENANAEIVMEILSVRKIDENKDDDYKDLFTMEQFDDYFINATFKQWHLICTKDLKDYYGEFYIQLNVSDLGDPPQNTEQDKNKDYKKMANINLHIDKFNFQAPIFIFPNNTTNSFSISSDQEPNTALVGYFINETFHDISISDTENGILCSGKWDPFYDVQLIDPVSVRNFFIIKKLEKCFAQLQVDESYNKFTAIDIVQFSLKISVTLANRIPESEEANYVESINITISFGDVNDDPIFDKTIGSWNISIQEDNDKIITDLPKNYSAFYPNMPDTDERIKYYKLIANEQEILDTFKVELETGALSLKKGLNYTEYKNYQFELGCGRNSSFIDAKEASRLSVNVIVLEINNHVPKWTRSAFFGAIMTTSVRQSAILTANATDEDEIDQGKLTYSYNSSISRSGSANLNNIENPFSINSKSGEILLNFQVEATMYGNFTFSIKVEDVKDDYGNGPHENNASVLISIVTENQLVTFKLENDLATIISLQKKLLEIISTNLEWNCQQQTIEQYTQDGIKYDNVTIANIYCIDEENLMLKTAEEIRTKLNNIQTFKNLKKDLLGQGVLLQSFDWNNTNVDTLENSLKIALIAVSVILGAFSIILVIIFFLKIRTLNKRLSKLTEHKFGSDESSINRKGINNAPTTNVFAVEGANPIFQSDFIKENPLSSSRIADNASLYSVEEDLVGLEDNPDFDEMFGKAKF